MKVTGISEKKLGQISAGDIVSRAWRLYRLNFRQVILFSLIPTVFFALAQIPQILMNSPDIYKDNPQIFGAVCCCVLPASYSFLIVGGFLAIFLNYFIINIFYNKLIGVCKTVKEIYFEAKQRIADLALLSLFILGQAIVFYIIDVLLMIIIMLIFIFPAAMIIGITKDSAAFSFVIMLLIFVVFMVTFLLFILIATLQCLFCFMQIVVFVAEKLPVIKTFKKSFSFTVNNINRSVTFMFTLLIVWYAMAMFFNMPAMYYMFYEMYREGLMGTANPYPIHALAIATFWGDLVSMFIWPMVISGVTLFYYDTKVRSEGLDLLLSLKQEKQNLQRNLA